MRKNKKYANHLPTASSLYCTGCCYSDCCLTTESLNITGKSNLWVESLICRQECESIDNIVLEYGITMGITKKSLCMKCSMSQLAVVRGAGAKQTKSHVKGTN